jgi:antitoxin component YwqK of YwqJK toxin-antitoxin module
VDFMARRALSAISIVISFALALASCADRHHTADVARSIDDISFTTVQDTLFYNGAKFTGLAFQLTATGDSLLSSPYENGLREGFTKKWYGNGEVVELRNYHLGQKHGPQNGWWPSGQKKYEFTASADHYEGSYKEWNQQGLLIKHFHYADGQESGAQQLWYDDGTTRANYVIKDGRRYGLLGTKNCKNVSDSVFRR